MVRKAKVYGKQKTNELVSAIQNLSLTTPPKGIDFSYSERQISCNSHSSGPYIDVQPSPALAPVSGNERRAERTKNNKFKDELANIENIPKSKILHPFHELIYKRLNLLLVTEIPILHGPKKTARSTGRLKEPRPEPKLTHQPRLPRASVSTAKGKQLSSVMEGKQKFMIE